MAKIVIVGGGVAGLSTGIYSAMAGHRVTVCERHRLPGGNLTGWKRRGCMIDNCIHWLTGTNPVTDTYRMWVELGALGNVKIKRPESLYTYSDGEKSMSLCRDLDALERKMLFRSPEDRGRTKSLMRAIRLTQTVCGIGGSSHDRSATTGDYLKVLPFLGKYAFLSTGELADSFKSELIRGFLRSLLGDEFSSLALIFVFAHFTAGNADLPDGGSVAMAERMSERFKSLGGELICGGEVIGAIRTDGKVKGVMLASGEVIEADYFVLACDPDPALKKIFSLPMPTGLKLSYRNEKTKRFSSYQTAFVCSRAALPFKGDYIFELDKRYKKLLYADYLILREFSHEPSFSPVGCSVIQTLTFLDEKSSRSFIELREKDKEKYARKKKRLAEGIERAICMRFPTLSGRLKLLDVWTPATYQRYTGAAVGSYMSFLLPKGRLPTLADTKLYGVKNVFLATQWQRSPGGLPTAAEMGKRCAEEIDAIEKSKAGEQEKIYALFRKRRREKA